MTSSDPVSPHNLPAAPHACAADAPVLHGGDVTAARARFPNAPEPIIDLSTGVNPHPYPIAPLAGDEFAPLPEPAALAALVEAAAAYYGAPSVENVVAAPGGQILMALVADSIPIGRAAVLGPTYGEHARVATLAGHDVTTVRTLAELGGAALAIVVNPNNPDGRVTAREDLVCLADMAQAHGAMLVVDEAFMDVGPQGASVCDSIDGAPIAVLRSFGKFFGLAGLRLSFAVTGRQLASRLRARLGPWPVSTPALKIGTAALSDRAWIERTRTNLKTASARLQDLLRASGLEPIGLTDLFCLAKCTHAQAVFERLGNAGIYVRRFEARPELLRFGLPGKEIEWRRLGDALQAPS